MVAESKVTLFYSSLGHWLGWGGGQLRFPTSGGRGTTRWWRLRFLRLNKSGLAVIFRVALLCKLLPDVTRDLAAFYVVRYYRCESATMRLTQKVFYILFFPISTLTSLVLVFFWRTSIGVAYGAMVPPNFLEQSHFCALRAGIPNKIVLFA